MNWIKRIIQLLNDWWNCRAELNDLKRYLMQTQNLPDISRLIKQRSMISYGKIDRVLSRAGVESRRIADLSYYTFSKDAWRKVLRKLWIKPFSYQSDVFDCDDFAVFMLNRVMLAARLARFKKQLCFGIAWSKIHAFNFLITKDEELYCFEPQTGTMFKHDPERETYRIRRAFLLI